MTQPAAGVARRLPGKTARLAGLRDCAGSFPAGAGEARP